MSAGEVKADVAATWPESPLLAESVEELDSEPRFRGLLFLWTDLLGPPPTIPRRV